MLKPFGVLYVHDDPTHAEVRAALWTKLLSRSMGDPVRVVPAATLRTAQRAILALTDQTRLVTAFIHKDLGQHQGQYGYQDLSELPEGMLPVAALTAQLPHQVRRCIFSGEYVEGMRWVGSTAVAAGGDHLCDKIHDDYMLGLPPRGLVSPVELRLRTISIDTPDGRKIPHEGSGYFFGRSGWL